MDHLDEALDGIWDSDDPAAARYLDLILEGRDSYEALRIVQATDTTFIPVEVDPEDILSCAECGAATTDLKAHREWHRDLEASLTEDQTAFDRECRVLAEGLYP